ncbi:uncharacterized protein LOC123532349 [Mercenaria mercenaria]|uniref:uncharacterized protein LOC123532349 n=1 Tax=Mercenaria mercenaria TaxID=6596 RepID=UPI00234E3901|nr:uncharacterized protein LOC123532349 [Mercenaria mercenaria]XP_045169709.2 uncharacterized protein LOC123532349 [Mercenaria mercenaria]
MDEESSWLPSNTFNGLDRRLNMGSTIVPKLGQYSPRILGVVGPFVRGTDNMFFVTANHVISQHWKYTDEDTETRDTETRVLLLIDKLDKNYEAYDCGRVVAGRRTGSIAALIQINQDLVGKTEEVLKTGKFPFAGISPINFPSYDNRNSRKRTQVYVFGKRIRTATAKIIVDDKRGRIILKTVEYNLLEPNEGGAAVFIVDRDNILHCMGIYVCGFEDNARQFVIIPIEVILQNLGQELGQQLEIVSFDNKRKETKSISSLDHTRLEINDVEYARYWMETNTLPDQDTLNTLAKKFGRKSEIVWKNCCKISSYIKNQSNKIINALPTYRPEDHSKIIFVIILRDEINIKERIKYSTVEKFLDSEKHRFGEEGKFVMYDKLYEEAHLSEDENKRVKNCIDKHADSLMNNHKFLTVITGSPIRSKNYRSSTQELKREVCLVLYVLIKGYIPIDEEVFATHYNDVGIDVREGMFSPFGLTAKSYHENLRLGCQIARQLLGTVGGFIEYPGYGLCGLTCAHVLLDSTEMRGLTNDPRGTKEWRSPSSNEYVFQPENDVALASRYGVDLFVGRLVKAVYRKGGGGQSGMDIALFQVERRYPNSGEFPHLQDGSRTEMKFCSGLSVGCSRLKCGAVRKFGATSDKTDGTVVMEAPSLSVKYYRTWEHLSDFKMVLHNLLEVKTLSVSAQGERVPFADFGDSGALVFCDGHDGEMLCVGVVEGGISTDTVAVMPIMPILNELNVPGFKNFELEKMRGDIDVLKQAIERLKEKDKHMKDTVNHTFQELKKQIDGIQRAVQQLSNK